LQTTLLGLAIAFIIALVAALIGPQFIDWNQFRPQFEAEASRVLGTPVRVMGTLDARLLPTPILRLQTVEVGGKNSSSKLSADQLDVSFALGSLMRGEVRADELSLDGFNLELGLDRRGHIDWPLSADRMDIGGLVIDKLNVAGRIAIRDAASNATLNLEDVVFSGDVRALAGTMRGDGKFSIDGIRSPFKISSGQNADGTGTHLRLIVDPGERGILADLDGIVAIEAMAPRFDGNITLARPVTPASTSGGETGLMPWKLTSHVTAGVASATLGQIDLSYGADEKSLKLSGVGDIRFGAAPVLRATLSSRQLDIDRLLADDAAAVRPIDAIPDIRTLIARLPVPPLPMQLEIDADQMVLGDRPMQNVSATLHGDATQWKIDHLSLLAPGTTKITMAGTVAPLGDGARFSGPLELQSGDPGLLAEWLGLTGAMAVLGRKPAWIHGNATVAADSVALDSFKANLDDGAIEGRMAVSPSDVQITLKADQFGLDRIVKLAGAIPASKIASLQKQWPNQARVSLDIAQARLAGRDIRPVALQFSLVPEALSLDRLTIGEGSGLSLSGMGQFDRTTAVGAINLKANSPSLADIGGLFETLSPGIAARLKAATVVTGPVQATMALSSRADPDDSSRAQLRAVIETDASPIKVSSTMTSSMARDADGALSFASFPQANVHLDTTATSAQADRLLALFGLDRIVAAGSGPAQLTSTIEGVWQAPLTIQAGLTGPSLALDIQGKGDPWSDQPGGTFKLKLDRADVAPLLGIAPGGTATLNVSLSSQLAIAGQTWTFDDIDSRIGASQLHGRVVFTRGDDLGIDGQLSADTLDLPSVLSFAIGATGPDQTLPLGRGLLQGWRGKLAFDAERATVSQGTVLTPLSGLVANDGRAVHIETTKAGVGGGTASIGLDLARSAEGQFISAKLQLTNVDASALAYRTLAMPSSRVSLEASVITRGRSAQTLSGALSGAGVVTLDNLHLSGLESRVFAIAAQASSDAQMTDDAKLKDLIDPLLASGHLEVASAQIPFSVKDSRLTIADTQLATTDVRVTVSGGYDMPADQVNIRAVLSQQDGTAAGAPGLTIFLLGPPNALVRTIDVSSLSSWLAIRAIDRETRRLDELNRDPSQISLPQSSLPVESPVKPDAALPSSDVRLPKANPRRRGSTPGPLESYSPDAASSNAALPPLPPPIDVQPSPGAARPAKPRPPLRIAPSSPSSF
jgi:large subunit ribosomal protein L24